MNNVNSISRVSTWTVDDQHHVHSSENIQIGDAHEDLLILAGTWGKPATDLAQADKHSPAKKNTNELAWVKPTQDFAQSLASIRDALFASYSYNDVVAGYRHFRTQQI